MSSVYQVYQWMYKTSPVVKGNGHSNYPYQVMNVTLAANNRKSGKIGIERYSGGLNVTSNSSMDYLKYVTGGGYTSPSNVISYPLNMQNALTVKLLNKIAASNFSLGSELAELDETVTYLAGRVSLIGRVVSHISRGDLKGVAKELGFSKSKTKRARKKLQSLRTIADKSSQLWLESRYAIRPLLISAEDLIKVTEEGIGINTDWEIPVSAKIYENLASTSKSGSTTHTCSGRATHRMKAIMRVKNRIQLAKDSLDLNTASMWWERITLSFVVDWAFGVGDWLKAINVLPNVEFITGSQSVRIAGKVNKAIKESTYPSYKYDSLLLTVDGYRRWVLTRLTLPLPEMKNPFQGFGDLDRVLDLMAIAYSGKPRHSL